MARNLVLWLITFAILFTVMCGMYTAVSAFGKALNHRSDYDRYERIWVEGK